MMQLAMNDMPGPEQHRPCDFCLTCMAATPCVRACCLRFAVVDLCGVSMHFWLQLSGKAPPDGADPVVLSLLGLYH